jgi:hypothetical protein
VDNLTPDFLDPILGEVQLELMQAIWRHIRPLPYPHGPQAARILGKLAGRNRRFLQHPQAIKSVRIRCPVDVVVVAGGRRGGGGRGWWWWRRRRSSSSSSSQPTNPTSSSASSNLSIY